MSTDVPSSYDHDVNVNKMDDFTVDTNINYLDDVDVNVNKMPLMQHDIGMSNIRVKEMADINSNVNVAVKEIPKIFLDSDIDMNTDNNIRIKEIPEIRTHLPAHYNVGFKLFGYEIASISLCGEGQIITEKYRPNRYERCEKTVCDEEVVPNQISKIEIYRDKADKYRWRILEQNVETNSVEVVGASAQGFASKADVVKEISRLQTRVSDGNVIDNSDRKK